MPILRVYNSFLPRYISKYYSPASRTSIYEFTSVPMSKPTTTADWEAWSRAQNIKGCPNTCWARSLPLPTAQNKPTASKSHTNISVDTSTRKALAARFYQPIKPWQTRILRLNPAPRRHEPVVCTLLVADVIAHEGLGVVEKDVPREVPYEALSYTWGAEIFSCPIIVNGVEFFVTENLDAALRHLRLTDSSSGGVKRYLWVDALCINQFDMQEKSIQVSRMSTIYKKARRVVAWHSGWTPQNSTILSGILDNMAKPQKHSDDCTARFNGIAAFLADACEPPLFKRTWVRQEVFGARAMVMQFNDLEIYWEDYERIKNFIAPVVSSAASDGSTFPDFTNALYLKSPFKAIMMLVQPDYQTDHKARNERNLAAVAAPVSLLDALVFSSSFGVSDPRDLVYGVLGFTTVAVSQGKVDLRQPTLNVDYHRSVSEVYQDVVRYEIERSGSLGILDFAGSHHPASSDLPSWTPDWRTYDPKLAQHRILNRTNSWKYGFIDIRKIGVSWKPIRQPPDSKGILLARGIVLGIVHDKIDKPGLWIPFVSPGFDAGFKERFGGRSFDDTDLFRDVRRDYKSMFYNTFKDGNLPLRDGKVMGVDVRKATTRLMTLAQVVMLDQIRAEVRNRVLASTEPIRKNHIIGLAPSGVSIAPKLCLPDDAIVLFEGSPCPFVLRGSGQGQYILIGRAIFPLWFEHKSTSFDESRRDERTWSSNNAVYTETSDVLESRFLWPEKMASIWKPVLQDAEFRGALEDFRLV